MYLELKISRNRKTPSVSPGLIVILDTVVLLGRNRQFLGTHTWIQTLNSGHSLFEI